MGASETSFPLDGIELEQALLGNLIGRRIVILPSATSTNDTVLQLAGKGAEEGLVVFAEQQTAGRGQRGHQWESAAGQGLWFSILLRPNIELAQSSRLTHWAAQGVAAVVTRELSVPATIKPPNDIYIDERKVAGVLVEMRAQPGLPHLVIAGIGLNVNQSAADFSPGLRSTATSLALATGRPVPRQNLAAALLRELDRSYRDFFAP